VLYFRDSNLNVPAAFHSKNEHKEQAILVNFLVDLKTPGKDIPSETIDSDQTTMYSELYTTNEEDTEMTDEAALEDEERRQTKMKNNEYIFLIDRSGSMNGMPIQLAVKALKVFLHSLPLGCLVNVYSFGSNFEILFGTSMEYTQDTLEMATEIVSTFGADLGGTELY